MKKAVSRAAAWLRPAAKNIKKMSSEHVHWNAKSYEFKTNSFKNLQNEDFKMSSCHFWLKIENGPHIT